MWIDIESPAVVAPVPSLDLIITSPVEPPVPRAGLCIPPIFVKSLNPLPCKVM